MADTLARAAREIEKYSMPGAEERDRQRSVTLFGASPESPIAQLVAGYGPRLAAEKIGLRVVFAASASAAATERFAAQARIPVSARGEAADAMRWACSSKYRQCHEQLVLGESVYICGATVADALRGQGTLAFQFSSRPQDVAAARFTFEMLWQAAASSPYPTSPRRSLLGYFLRMPRK